MYNEEAFLNKHVPDWRKLDEMCARTGASFRPLSGKEVVDFVRLYRQASGDLAYLMTHSSNAEVVVYLNNVVGKAYAQLYRTPTKRLGDVIHSSLLTVAQTFRRRFAFIALAFAIFVAGGVYSYTLITVKPETHEKFVPPMFQESFDQWKSGSFPVRSSGMSLGMTGFYITNNPTAAIQTVATSVVSAGVLTTQMMWENGTTMGALTHDMAQVGLVPFLYSSILPHGASELSGIFVAGGAGFVLAWALIRPGRKTRLQSLREAGKDAFTLGMLSLAMMAIAAPIEGFFSFNPAVPQWLKVVFAACAFGAWGTYFYGYGRKYDQPKEADGTVPAAGASPKAAPGSAIARA